MHNGLSLLFRLLILCLILGTSFKAEMIIKLPYILKMHKDKRHFYSGPVIKWAKLMLKLSH